MTDITIPQEALEAAAREICIGMGSNPDALSCDGSGRLVWMCWKAEARAACLAMLKAWPGMDHDQGALVTDTYRDPGKIILPLPTEKLE